jgi:YVTN family beta-propeller protein
MTDNKMKTSQAGMVATFGSALVTTFLMAILLLNPGAAVSEEPQGEESWILAPPLEFHERSFPQRERHDLQQPVMRANLPDLNVAFIGRTPAYPYDGHQKWPEPGQAVTFTAKIANRGTVASGPFQYQWTINGNLQFQAVHAGLAPGQEDHLTLSWNWLEGSHTVGITLDPANLVAEVSGANNAVVDPIHALALGIWVEQSFYDFFNANVLSAGWGGNSFDDWVQRHVQIWNEMFAEAGAIDRVRADKIVVAPDGALNCSSNVPAADRTVDLIWGFMSEMVGVPSPSNCYWWTPRYRDDPNTWNHDMGLIHELNHARYHIDLYGFNMYIHGRPLLNAVDATTQSIQLVNPPDFVEFQAPVYFALNGEFLYCTSRAGNTFANCTRGALNTTPRSHPAGSAAYVATIKLQDGLGNALLGSPVLPVESAYGGLIYKEPYFYEDIMSSGSGYGAYSVAVLDRIARQRARCGNYNAPCNIGEFLQEIAPQNRLEVRSATGQPVANATIEIYRAHPYPQVWYARQFENEPDLILVTDGNGQVQLTSSPFSAGGNIVHGWGFSNSIALAKVVAQGAVEVRFLNVTDFNLAYWQGIANPIFTMTLAELDNAVREASHGVVDGAIFAEDGDLLDWNNARRLSNSDHKVYLPLVKGNIGPVEPDVDTLMVALGPENRVVFIDAESGVAVREGITTGIAPVCLIADPQGRYVVVVNLGSDTITILDRQTGATQGAVSVGHGPRCGAINQAGNTAYIANNGSRDVSIVDLASGGVVGALGLNSYPEGIAVAPFNPWAYVAGNSSAKVSTINTATNTLGEWFHIGRQPQATAVNPNGQSIYVVDFFGALHTVHINTFQHMAMLALPGAPHRIAITPDGAKAYVANHAAGFLSVVDLASNKVTAQIEMGSPQWSMDMSPDGSLLFVSLYESKEVAVVNTQLDQIVRKVATPGKPTAVHLIPLETP